MVGIEPSYETEGYGQTERMNKVTGFITWYQNLFDINLEIFGNTQTGSTTDHLSSDN